MRLADCVLPVFINEKVCAKKAAPHTVATMPESSPVIPNLVGSNPNGIRNSV